MPLAMLSAQEKTGRDSNGVTVSDGATGVRTFARPPRSKRHLLRGLAVFLACCCLVFSGFFIGGFFKFAEIVAAQAPPDPLVADGIVVLTGGAERIAGAVELISEGKARRLLISGVHPDTSARQIGRMVDAGPDIMKCCVDLDHRAANTVGNAVETAKWAHRNGFLSLIVVTSSYHMPRAMLELSHAMPQIRLIAYPVSRQTLELARWYRNEETMTLLLAEYVKYMATRVRLSLGGIEGLAEALAAAAG
jgi:uncharacterized SAM-binding protein YcdF (DUF218 family)